MRLTIVSSSHRLGANSAKIGEFIKRHEIESGVYQDVQHFDLAKLNIPMWEEGLTDTDPKWRDSWFGLKEVLQYSHALVLITPEWGGMATPQLKNLLLLCSGQELGHKPGLLISVSSGISGAYPIAELKMTAFKNNQMLVLPDHLIVRDADNVLNGEAVNGQRDMALRERLAHQLRTLSAYSKSLSEMRANVDFDLLQYAYGM